MNTILESTKVFNELRNGSDFLTNPGVFTTTFKVNVGEKIKVVSKFRVLWDAFVTPGSTDTFVVAAVTGGHSLTSTIGQDFETLGFRVGDVFDFINTPAAPTLYAGQTITLVSGSYMEFTLAAALPVATYNDARIVGTSQLNNLVYDFNLTASSDSENLINAVFNLIMTYEYSGLVVGGAFVPGLYNSSFFSKSGVSQARQLANVNTYEQVYEVETTLTVPYYQEGQLSNLELALKPEPFNVETQFYKEGITLGVGNNGATNRTFDLSRLANDSVGYNNENFNGGARQYSIVSVAYEELTSGDAREVPEITETTKVTVVMASNDTTMLTATPTIVAFSYLPLQSAYRSGINSFDNTWNFESLRTDIDAAPASGAIITNFISVLDGPNQVTQTFNVSFAQAQQDIMFEGGSFLLTTDNEDSTLAVEDSNRLNLIIDVNTLTKNTDIPGLVTIVKDEVYYHPDVFNDGVSVGFTNINEWNEGNIMRDIHFTVATSPDLVEVNRMYAQIIAYNPTTEDYFIIQKTNIPFNTDAVTIDSGNEIQNSNLNSERGFLLPTDSQFNFLKVDTSTYADPDQLYKVQVGIMTNWQYWIDNVFVDSSFFDKNKPLNNKNQKTSNYSDLNGFEIRLSVLHEMKKTDIITQYHNIQPKGLIFDYDLDKNVSPKFTITHEYKDKNDVVLAKKLIRAEDTTLTSTYSDGSARVNVDEFEAVVRMERKEQGTEKSIHVISSIEGVIGDDVLKPILGETLLKKTLVLGSFTTQCLVDGLKLNTSEWSITSALYEKEAIVAICFEVTGSPSFDALIGINGGGNDLGLVLWNFGDGSPIFDGTDIVHVYADTNVYTVCATLLNPAVIADVNMNNDGVLGDLDLTEIPNINFVNLSGNPGLTQIFTSASLLTLNQYSAFDCDLTGTLDVSMLAILSLQIYNNPNLTGVLIGPDLEQIGVKNCDLTGTLNLSAATVCFVFDLKDNPNLTEVINPISSQGTTFYALNNCNITGVLDFSVMTGLGGTVNVINNDLLTSITFPVASTGTNIILNVTGNATLAGTLDISGMTDFLTGTSLQLQSNPLLTGITNPATTKVLAIYWAQSCDLGYIDFTVIVATWNNVNIKLQNNSMTAAEVNHILVDLDNTGWINGNLNISGSNAAPDGVSGGFDGTTAKANLIVSGWTVTTS